MLAQITHYFADALSMMQSMYADETLHARIAKVANCLVQCFQQGGRVFWAGNGGSAADAQHLSAELLGRFQRNRRGLPSLSLTADTAVITALANDFGYTRVIAHQLEAMAVSEDVFFALSTSGASPNILEALSYARAHRIITIGFTGLRVDERMCDLLDHAFVIPSTETALVQEGYMRIGHIICACVEQMMFFSAEEASQAVCSYRLE